MRRRVGTCQMLCGALAACGGEPARESEHAAAARAALARVDELMERAGLAGLRSASGDAVALETAAVELASTAALPFRIAHARSGVAVDVRLIGAGDVRAERVGSSYVYLDALEGGAHVVNRPSPAGTEDHVLFERVPSEGVIRYELALGPGVAGLRRVAGALEVVDGDGVPRLRMLPPVVVDGDGARHSARAEIEDCSYDADPSAPWRRKPVDPGSRSCTVVVHWDPRGLRAPVLLDPVWTTTGSMSGAHSRHQAVVLSGGDVLVAGGADAAFTRLSTAELYHPASGAWSVTGSMALPRDLFTMTVLANGKVLVTGGYATTDYESTAELYDPGPGTWAATGVMASRRGGHVAALLSTGRVLVAGGYSGAAFRSTAELYDPANGNFANTAPMSTRRFEFTATVLPGGDVLVAGGYDGSYLSTAERYTSASPSWAAAGTFTGTRTRHGAGLLPGGRVLVAGGASIVGSTPPSVELYDSGSWTTVGALGTPRDGLTLTVLGDGRAVLAAGYRSGSGSLATTDVYDPTVGTLTNVTPMAVGRNYATASLLGTGSVLLVGGTGQSSYLSSAELFGLLGAGTACTVGAECGSRFCVDGVCCDRACAGTCEACTTALRGSGADGSCGSVANGSDPENECDDAGAATCGLDGSCNGAAACRSYASGTACAAVACTDGATSSTLVGSTCNGAGNCLPSNSDCGAYRCASAGACATSCAGDAGCVPSSHCRSSDGSCRPDHPNGAPCASASQCASGQCVDATCCDSPCAGACEACSAAKTGAADGACAPVSDTTDPDGDCPEDGAASCARNGTCDGQGACKLYGAGTPCGSGSGCAGNVATGERCDGLGACAPNPGGTSCDPFLCSAGQCTTACSNDAECAATAFCDAGQSSCQPKRNDGDGCDGDSRCRSGRCVDSRCCSAPCTGQCEACDVGGAEGTCVPVKGAPHAGRPSCAASGDPCAGASCDGAQRDACAGFPGPETSCRQPSCEGGVETLAAGCDGSGGCAKPETRDCAPYACGAASCLASCIAPSDCAEGYSCLAGRCVASAHCDGDHTLELPDGTTRDCGAYRCTAEGTCRESCASSAECGAGYRCDASGGCVTSAGAGASGDAGCACRAGPQPEPRHASSLMLPLLLALRRRRPTAGTVTGKGPSRAARGTNS